MQKNELHEDVTIWMIKWDSFRYICRHSSSCSLISHIVYKSSPVLKKTVPYYYLPSENFEKYLVKQKWLITTRLFECFAF